MKTALRTFAPLALALACAALPQAGFAIMYSNNPTAGTARPPEISDLGPHRANIREINLLSKSADKVSPGVSAKATAQCLDGSISMNRDILSTCAYHGGVDKWFTPTDRGIHTDQMALNPG